MRNRVIIESPLSGNVRRNVAYARAAMRDALLLDYAPFASHLLYAQTGVLDDTIPKERRIGIEAGFVWGAMARTVLVYQDFGISDGMREGIEQAKQRGQHVEYRNLPPEIMARFKRNGGRRG